MKVWQAILGLIVSYAFIFATYAQSGGTGGATGATGSTTSSASTSGGTKDMKNAPVTTPESNTESNH